MMKNQRIDEEGEEYGFTYGSEERNRLLLKKNKNRKKYLEITGKENNAPFSQRDSPEKHQSSVA